LKFNIWDSVGQQVGGEVNRRAVVGASCGILMYDLTSRCYMDRPTRLSFVIFGRMRNIFQSHQCFLETRSIANIAWHFYLSFSGPFNQLRAQLATEPP